jgi:hypothetical protein
MLATLKGWWATVVNWVQSMFGVVKADAQSDVNTIKTDINVVKTDIKTAVSPTTSTTDSTQTK